MTKRTKEGKGMGDVLYISLVLDKESRMRLIKKTKRYSPDWKNGNVIAEHHTIAFFTSLTEDIYNWAVQFEVKFLKCVPTNMVFLTKRLP